MRILGSAMRY